MEPEAEALGIPWAGRGARLDETLDVLQAMWTSNPVQHAGQLWEIPPSTLYLGPVRTGGPPVLLGGYSEKALAGVGRRASGWLPSIAPGRDLGRLDQPWQA